MHREYHWDMSFYIVPLFLPLSQELAACLAAVSECYQSKMSFSSYYKAYVVCPQWMESRRTGFRKGMDISRCHHTRQLSLGKQEAELYLGTVSDKLSLYQWKWNEYLESCCALCDLLEMLMSHLLTASLRCFWCLVLQFAGCYVEIQVERLNPCCWMRQFHSGSLI